MPIGTIKSKIDDKGFGFISINGSDNREHKDLFFHTTQCISDFKGLRLGEEVEFRIEDSPKGKRAVDVRRI
jgi:cold shock CspA family protein